MHAGAPLPECPDRPLFPYGWKFAGAGGGRAAAQASGLLQCAVGRIVLMLSGAHVEHKQICEGVKSIALVQKHAGI